MLGIRVPQFERFANVICTLLADLGWSSAAFDIERQFVKSNSILTLAHDPTTCELHVEYINGVTCKFLSVSTLSFAALLETPDLDTAFQNQIQTKHKAKKTGRKLPIF